MAKMEISPMEIRQMYMAKLDLGPEDLQRISTFRRCELVNFIRIIIIERWRSSRFNYSYVFPTSPEIANYLYGVCSKSNEFMCELDIKSHEFNVKLLVEAFNYFTGLYQNYASDL